ncbi:hypothetical protein [Fusobacterium nucleatum]|nr:hypothetical protein [Fusobacterium nucleatum]
MKKFIKSILFLCAISSLAYEKKQLRCNIRNNNDEQKSKKKQWIS